MGLVLLYFVTFASELQSILMIKACRLIRAGHVARVGDRRGAYRVIVGKPAGGNHLKSPGVDERIILEWIL
jgi:hypothetical protein